MAYLVIERGNDQGKRIPVNRFPFEIGRDSTLALILNDEEISRRHCRIKCRGETYVIEDLESKNGTYVNGHRTVNSTIVNGDKILVGHTELLFLAAHADITVVSDFSKLEWQADLDPSISIVDPAALEKVGQSLLITSSRFDPQTYQDQKITRSAQGQSIHSSIEDLMIMETLAEAGKVLLKSAANLLPGVTTGVFFAWQEVTRKLVPFSQWKHSDGVQFHIDRQGLRDAVTRKQGLHSKIAKGHNLILPMNYHGSTLGVLHLERTGQPQPSGEELQELSTLIYKAAPLFETLILRSEMDSWLVGMVETIIALVEAKDTYTSGHSERVCRYAVAMADELALKKETKRMLMISALCHDIGKVGIPDVILKKASILSAEEYSEMKLHPILGAEILKHLPHYTRFLGGVRSHHEKWDGSGYPDGLVGEAIPFFGRIIAIADVFDAMVSGRAYSGFMDQSEAVEKLSTEIDLFDKEIFKAFISAYEKGCLSLKTTTKPNGQADETPAAILQTLKKSPQDV